MKAGKGNKWLRNIKKKKREKRMRRNETMKGIKSEKE